MYRSFFHVVPFTFRHLQPVASAGLFLFMNNAFAIGTADTELVYIITIDAGAVIIARNTPRKILRFEVEFSDVLADLCRSKGEWKYETCCFQEKKNTLIFIEHQVSAGNVQL